MTGIRTALKALAISITLTLSVSGCVSHAQLDERLIVQIMGFDFDEEGYTVSLKYSLGKEPKSGGGSSEGGSKIKTIKGTGINVYSAIKQAEEKAGKELFFSQNQVIILGGNIIRSNAVYTLQCYLRECEKRPTAFVVGTLGKAVDIVDINFTGETPGTNKINMLIEHGIKLGVSDCNRVYETLTSFYGAASSAYVPLLEITQSTDSSGGASENNAGESGSGNKQNGDGESGGGETPGGGEASGESGGGKEADTSEKDVTLKGAAVIIGENGMGEMDLSACAGLALLKNKSEDANITFLLNGAPASMELYAMKTTVKPRYENNRLIFEINFKAKGREFTREINEELLTGGEHIKKLAEETVKASIRTTIEQSVRLGADLIFLEESLRVRDYKAWVKLSENWSEAIKNSRFEYRADIKINRYSIK